MARVRGWRAEIQTRGTRQSEYLGYGYTDSPFFCYSFADFFDVVYSS
ncbi:MAG: hypothetical protein PVG48_01800 [Candidatus Bathyarchaeota archaeon]